MKLAPLSLLALALTVQIAAADNSSPPPDYNNDAPVFGHDTQLKGVNWKNVFNQLFYWNILKFYPANEKYKAEALAENSIYYSPKGFNEILNFVEGRDANGNFGHKNASGINPNNNSADENEAKGKLLDFFDHPDGTTDPVVACNPITDPGYAKETMVQTEERYPGDTRIPNACYLAGNRPVQDKFVSGRTDFVSSANYKGKATLGTIKDTGTAAATLARALWASKANTYGFNKNYFQTPEGQMVSQALKDTILVVVPGFGSHSIPDYTYPEIVQDANLAHGRLEIRHVEESKTTPPEPKYAAGQSPGAFYGAGPSAAAPGFQTYGFDIVHPMGREQGNTMGKDDAAADNLARFLRCDEGQDPATCLPASYSKKKLILVGYSKGCPVAHDMVARHKDIRDRTLAIVTIAGVNQGALPAEDGFRTIEQGLKVTTPPDAMKKLQTGHIELKTLDPEVAAKVAALIALGAGKQLIGQLLHGENIDGDKIVSTLSGLLNPDQLEQALEGIYDMTQYQRIKWNLVHMNDDVFDDDINIFNLSVLTNLEDFANPPGGYVNQGPSTPTSLFPQFYYKNGKLSINEAYLSRDNLFLFFTSFSGFASAPGGMFDTQVAYPDTKALPLDDRTIYEELHYTPKQGSELSTNDIKKEQTLEQNSIAEINRLVLDVNNERAALIKDLNAERLPTEQLAPLPKVTIDDMMHLSRRALIAKLGSMKHFNLVDLGDLRGTHWDTAFCEVYKADGITKCRADDPDHYSHTFPRKAMLTALLETMAIYKSGLSSKEISNVAP